ncbi:Protoporphyrinogen IX dehydrogenase [menaquinone] [Candidatus Hartigia pinicola]|nr:Protoporphyrinogen IX dehydrogenase [menaquinone] [Candidatus Hartigia pinicola]
MSYLLLYSSTHGHTKKIILKISEQLKKLGHRCDIKNLNTENNLNLLNYDKILVGASIRYGHFNKSLLRFSKMHHSQLNAMKSAFFSVNLIARKKEKKEENIIETNSYTRKFLKKSPWKPTLKTVFSGALYYPRYNWFDKIMICFIMKITNGPTDLKTTVEYTDWKKVNIFTNKFEKL